jgi:hypothetical protein
MWRVFRLVCLVVRCTAPGPERLVPSVAISAATWGSTRIAAYLLYRWHLRVAPAPCSAPCGASLATRRQGFVVLEHGSLQTAGLLTEWMRRQLGRATHGHIRPVAAREPGELVCDVQDFRFRPSRVSGHRHHESPKGIPK